MTKIKFSYKMDFTFDNPVKNHAFSILAFPQSMPEQQVCGFSWRISPQVGLSFQTDCFGNKVGAGFYGETHRSFSFEMDGVAWMDREKRKPEPLQAIYRYTSEYCKLTSELNDFLRQIGVPEYASPEVKTLRMMDALYESFRYESGSTGVHTSAGEAFVQGSGVCQDYAQILITLCRAKGIPARYVAGIIAGEGATHAWVEIYDGCMWQGFDPTHNCVVDNLYLKLANGRDSLDCRLNRGVFQGLSNQTQDIFVNLEEVR